MNIFSNKWTPMVLAAVVVAAILIVAAVIRPWNKATDTQSVLAKASEANSTLQSYRLSGSGASTGGTSGIASNQDVEAEFSPPDRYHAKLTENGQVDEFIVIGNKEYVRNGLPSGAVEQGLIQSTARMFSKEFALDYLTKLTGIQNLTDESIEGVTCLHYKGKWDVEKQIAEMNATIPPGATEVGKQSDLIRLMNIDIELWIGKQDYLIRQMRVQGQTPDNPEGTKFNVFSELMTYYDFGQPVSVEAPLDASGQLLSGWQVIGQ
jgi:hypothetical protein